MVQYACDLCGARLKAGENTRYVVRIEVYAAPESPEITPEELAKDHKQEILALLSQMDSLSTEEIQNGVYRLMRFDLCAECRDRYLANPLGKGLLTRLDTHKDN